MANKLDNIINSKIFFICEKNKESVSIKKQITDNSVLDDDYLEKIKKWLKKKNTPSEVTQGLDLSQTSMKESHIFSHMSPKNEAKKSPSVQDIETYRDAYPSVDPLAMKKKTSVFFSTENNRRKEIPLEFSSARLLAQEKKLLIQDDDISVKPDIYVDTSLSANKKNREGELSQSSLPLENHFSTRVKAVPISDDLPTPSSQTLRTPFNLPENKLITPEKPLISSGDNEIVYHFNKWQGSNSVRIQWDQRDKHQLYLEPSNTEVLHHILDNITALPPKLKVVLQEEQRHSKQRNSNENREDKKGKR